MKYKDMRIKMMVVCGAALAFWGTETVHAKPISHSEDLASVTFGGGGDDKEKKEKKEKGGGRKEKDESTKDAKTSDVSAKPFQHARYSAKTAKYTTKMAQKEILGRAKVRNFFHNTFNTKYGKPVNFRSTRQRNRWKHGH
jgi:hypothetical protein